MEGRMRKGEERKLMPGSKKETERINGLSWLNRLWEPLLGWFPKLMLAECLNQVQGTEVKKKKKETKEEIGDEDKMSSARGEINHDILFKNLQNFKVSSWPVMGWQPEVASPHLQQVCSDLYQLFGSLPSLSLHSNEINSNCLLF